MWCSRPLLTIVLCLCVSEAFGAIAEVSSTRATTASNGYSNAASANATAFGANLTQNHLAVIAGVNWNAVTQTMAVTGCSSTWSVIQGADRSGDGGVYKPFIAYTIVGATGACTPTIDPSGTGNYGSYSMTSFSGVDTSNPLDVDGASSSGTSTAPLDTITTSTANALIVGVSGCAACNTTFTVGSGFTQIGEVESPTNAAHNAEFKLGTTATSYNVDWTLGNSVLWFAQSVSFKESGAGGGAVACRRALMGVGC